MCVPCSQQSHLSCSAVAALPPRPVLMAGTRPAPEEKALFQNTCEPPDALWNDLHVVFDYHWSEWQNVADKRYSAGAQLPYLTHYHTLIWKFQYAKIVLKVLPFQALPTPRAYVSLQATSNFLPHLSFNLISMTHKASQTLQINVQSKQRR